MFVRVLGFDRMDGRVSRLGDGVEDSEAHYHDVLLAGKFRLAGAVYLCLESSGVGFRRCSPPKDRFELLGSLIWKRLLCRGERCRSRHALGD